MYGLGLISKVAYEGGPCLNPTIKHFLTVLNISRGNSRHYKVNINVFVLYSTFLVPIPGEEKKIN